MLLTVYHRWGYWNNRLTLVLVEAIFIAVRPIFIIVGILFIIAGPIIINLQEAEALSYLDWPEAERRSYKDTDQGIWFIFSC